MPHQKHISANPLTVRQFLEPAATDSSGAHAIVQEDSQMRSLTLTVSDGEHTIHLDFYKGEPRSIEKLRALRDIGAMVERWLQDGG